MSVQLMSSLAAGWLVLAGADHHAPQPGAAVCGLEAEAPLLAELATGLTVQAVLDCGAERRAVLTVRDVDGAVLLERAYPPDEIMTLAWVEDAAGMQAALEEWIALAPRPASEILPAWDQRFAPAEFPFYPDEAISEARYRAIRAADAPVVCYVQGMESALCLAWHADELTPVGLQLFPG